MSVSMNKVYNRNHLHRSCKQVSTSTNPLSRTHLNRNCKLLPGAFAVQKAQPISRENLRRACNNSVSFETSTQKNNITYNLRSSR